MEKLIKLLLSFVIVCTMLSPMSIKGQSTTMPYKKIEFQTIEEFVEPNEELRKTPVMALMEKTEEEILFELEDLIKNALLEGRDFVDISHLAIERKSHSTIDYFKSFSPYISGGVDIAIYYWDNFYTTLSLTNTMSTEETKEYFDRVDAKIEEIMQVISPEYSDEENALRLHDYLVFNYEYDTVLLETQETEKYKDSFRSGGIIMNGVGVCQAYAFAYKYFLNKIGMDCMFYPSNTMGHVWNIVTIDGELYHVDATFDDPITDQLYNVSHRNFLNSTARMLENGYHSFNYPEIVATSTKYDNSFYKNIKSQIIIDNNDLYYVTDEGLYKSNKDGTNPVLIDDLGIWEANEGGYYEGKFASLFLYDRKIYYNTQSNVYSYDLDTKQKEEIYELDRKDKRIYGVINKNGVLYVNLVEIPGLAKNLVATDIIFSGEYIEVEKVIADKQEIELLVGEEGTINVSVLPENATNKTVTYTSSDKSVVSVSDGKLKGVSEGEAIITIASSNNKTASVKVYVKESKYASDMEWIENIGGYFANTRDASDSNPISLYVDGTVQTFKKGIGTHADSRITIDIEGKEFKKFTAIIGINSNQRPGAPADVIFRVYVDGVEKLAQRALAGQSFPIEVDVNGAKTITLVVDKNGTDSNDHASWADAKFEMTPVEIIIDKSKLNSKIEEVKDTNADNYTLESYVTFAIALDNAKTVLADSNATQEEVDKTLADLNNAYLNLKEKEVLVLPTSVSLNKSSITLNVGETIELKATVLPENAVDKTVTWISGDEDIVKVLDGKVTAMSAGTAAIIVETTNGKKATCLVEVKETEVYPSNISLNEIYVTLDINEKLTLKATVLPENSTNKTVIWTSSNNDIVSVNDGEITAVSAGSATVTVETVNGKKATCLVIVNEPKVIEPTLVMLNEIYLTLEVGQVALLTATVLPENAENKTLTWLSSDEEVVKVTDGKVEAVGAGVAAITVKTHNGKIATCIVTVNEKVKPVKNGWEKVDGKWYFFVDDAKQTGWVKDAGKWYFMDESGAMQTGWVKDNNKWYYLNTHMMTGWQKIDGKWYYLNSHMITGWLNDGGKWYYLDSAMKTGWQKIDGKWYYLNSHMLTGWQKVNGTWYYLNSAMVTGWLKINDTWYYFNSNGAMVTGTVTIDGKVQKFNSNGAWLG